MPWDAIFKPSFAYLENINLTFRRGQVKAIYAIAKQLGTDLADALHQQFGVHRPEELTVKQASALIDTLKSTRTASVA